MKDAFGGFLNQEVRNVRVWAGARPMSLGLMDVFVCLCVWMYGISVI